MASLTMLASPSIDESDAPESHLAESIQGAAAGNTAYTSHWRPDSPASEPAPTTRSSSPLLDQWVRKQQAIFHLEEAQRQAERNQHLQSRQQRRQAVAQPDADSYSHSHSPRSSGFFKLPMATRSGSVQLRRLSGTEAVPAPAPAPAGTNHALTRDEFDCLPPAVQRKVRWLVGRFYVHSSVVLFNSSPAIGCRYESHQKCNPFSGVAVGRRRQAISQAGRHCGTHTRHIHTFCWTPPDFTPIGQRTRLAFESFHCARPFTLQRSKHQRKDGRTTR
jgi:hypothetical protein